ncbi:MAG: hypothetical protein AB7P04_15650 [Bacteriovoracia bacterium]
MWQALQQANPEYPTTLEYLVLLDGTEQTAGLPAVTTVEELHQAISRVGTMRAGNEHDRP